MRSSIILILLLSVLSMLSAQRGGNDRDYQTEDRKVSSDFTRLDVSSAIQVEVTKGSSHAITVKADARILPYIKTEVSGDRLEIYVSSRKPNMRNTGKMLVMITMPTLEGVEAGGASKVTTMSKFTGSSLSVDVNGAAQAQIEFEGDEVEAEVSGAGTIRLVGKANEVDFDASSAGSIRAKDLIAKVARVDASSASSVRLTVTEEIRAEATSASTIRYDGNPTKVYTDTSSAATISG